MNIYDNIPQQTESCFPYIDYHDICNFGCMTNNGFGMIHTIIMASDTTIKVKNYINYINNSASIFITGSSGSLPNGNSDGCGYLSIENEIIFYNECKESTEDSCIIFYNCQRGLFNTIPTFHLPNVFVENRYLAQYENHQTYSMLTMERLFGRDYDIEVKDWDATFPTSSNNIDGLTPFYKVGHRFREEYYIATVATNEHYAEVSNYSLIEGLSNASEYRRTLRFDNETYSGRMYGFGLMSEPTNDTQSYWYDVKVHLIIQELNAIYERLDWVYTTASDSAVTESFYNYNVLSGAFSASGERLICVDIFKSIPIYGYCSSSQGHPLHSYLMFYISSSNGGEEKTLKLWGETSSYVNDFSRIEVYKTPQIFISTLPEEIEEFN